jgi:hypothetical protein
VLRPLNAHGLGESILFKWPMTFLTELKKSLKIHMKAQKTPNSQHNPERKEQCQEASQYLISKCNVSHVTKWYGIGIQTDTHMPVE